MNKLALILVAVFLLPGAYALDEVLAAVNDDAISATLNFNYSFAENESAEIQIFAFNYRTANYDLIWNESSDSQINPKQTNIGNTYIRDGIVILNINGSGITYYKTKSSFVYDVPLPAPPTPKDVKCGLWCDFKHFVACFFSQIFGMSTNGGELDC